MPGACAIKSAGLGSAGVAGRMSSEGQKYENHSTGEGGNIVLWLSRWSLESGPSSNSFLVTSSCVILGSLPKVVLSCTVRWTAVR